MEVSQGRNEIRNIVELKPDWETTYLRMAIYLGVLNLPFGGLYRAALTGTLEPGSQGLILAGLTSFAVSIYFCYLFNRIRFGWSEVYVFKQGLFRRTEIQWSDIKKIYETGDLQGWTESDITFIKPKMKGKRLFVIEGGNEKIVLDNYPKVLDLKSEIIKRLDLKIEDKYNFVYDWVIGG